jgi:hypothetical protein
VTVTSKASKKVCELGGSVVGERGAEVGDRREQRFDLVRLRRVAPAGFELSALLVECGALSGEFFDTDLRGGHDGVVRVVVFFESERLPADRLVEVGELPDGGGEFCRATVVAVGERSRSAGGRRAPHQAGAHEFPTETGSSAPRRVRTPSCRAGGHARAAAGRS